MKMMDLLKKFFTKTSDEVSAAESVQTSRDVRIATCALLLEMAKIDGKFSELERKSIVEVLENSYQLSAERATAFMEAADEQLEKSIDLWHFAKRINVNYSTEEKIKIIEMVWQIIYTDGILDKHEDYLAHKLANLLRLSHEQLIEAKLKVIHEGPANP
jgi:uncharacterized tellurite resistance protein B-like protein